MYNDFQKFVIESTHLHEDALAHQIKVSEDVNKYSTWFIGISTAGIGLLIARYDGFIESSWICRTFSSYVLIVVGVLRLLSISLGVWHHYLSLEENFYSRKLITFFGAQRLVSFFKHPDYPESVPYDMHNRISDGELLNDEKRNKFKYSQQRAKELRACQSKVLKAQQIFAGIAYVLLFVVSAHI